MNLLFRLSQNIDGFENIENTKDFFANILPTRDKNYFFNTKKFNKDKIKTNETIYFSYDSYIVAKANFLGEIKTLPERDDKYIHGHKLENIEIIDSNLKLNLKNFKILFSMKYVDNDKLQKEIDRVINHEYVEIYPDDIDDNNLFEGAKKQDVIFLLINNSYKNGDAKELYEATNFAWGIAKQKAKENSIKYAFAIYHNQIKEVYKIDKWLPADQRKPKTRDITGSDEKLKKYFAFDGKVATGIRNYFIGKNVESIGQKGFTYKNFNELKEKFYIVDDNLLNDLEEILGEKISTEKENLVKCRIGQGEFRDKLIEYWKGCSVTGLKQSDILIASHIKPWSKANNKERLDLFNGLLLLPTLDKLFDRGYVSFDDNGKILIAEALKDFGLLGITKDMNISIKKEHKKYLSYHRNEIFKNI
jgi:hypothetical protein